MSHARYLCSCPECQRHRPPPRCHHTVEMFPPARRRGDAPEAPAAAPVDMDYKSSRQADLFSQEVDG